MQVKIKRSTCVGEKNKELKRKKKEKKKKRKKKRVFG